MRTPITIVLFVLFLAYASLSAAETYVYETQKVALTGILVEKTFYGPPGYGEDLKHDTKERAYILRLQEPITAVPDQQDTIYERHDNVTKVQVVNMKDLHLKALLKKRVTISGTLFSAISGHHHTKVLIAAEEAALSSGGASGPVHRKRIVKQ